MKKLLCLLVWECLITSSVHGGEPSLVVVFPPTSYKTSTEKIFFLGAAPPKGLVSINGQQITRSKAGYFAPSLPLALGDNFFTIRYRNQEKVIKVTRVSLEPEIPQGLNFAANSLTPADNIARLPKELICFSAIAPQNAQVSVNLNHINVPLNLQPPQAQLPDNHALLTGHNQPITQSHLAIYQGCTKVSNIGNLGQPEFQLSLNGQTITQLGKGRIQILSPEQLSVVEVTAERGVARTGPSNDFSRLTPLPKGTRCVVTGQEGNWLRLDYGAWINSQETRILAGAVPPHTTIRSVGYRQQDQSTEIVFPLQVPVPLTVQQGERSFTLTLYNTIAQTDVIRLDDDPLISDLNWQQISLEPEVVQYTFNLKQAQQWGYDLRYDNTTLILTLRHSPAITNRGYHPLNGIKILLDPGHGGAETGAVGPNGAWEKDVNLVVARLLRQELVKRGATVVMTRDSDQELSLAQRQGIIQHEQPAIALSIHHNSLPDDGNAEKIKGFSAYWYNHQAHSLAVFLHNYVVKKLHRPSYGVYWDNLALTRPTIAPSVLLELGFMSNPEEFEQLIEPKEQQKIAKALAEGITEWFLRTRSYPKSF
jgi:N-acetylmuramoyl-L-alanine amidase